jgi:hypothetical protein
MAVTRQRSCRADADEMAGSRVEGPPSILPAAAIDKLYHHFLRLDADGNGHIGRDEFLSFPGIRGNPLASRALAVLDADRGGSLSFAEFVNGLAIFSGRGARALPLTSTTLTGTGSFRTASSLSC